MRTEMTTRSANHRVLAIYDDAELTIFNLPSNATMAELAESIARRAPHLGQLPVHIEINVAH